MGGNHVGGAEKNGTGYVERIHGEVAPCCGMLYRLMTPYLTLYQRAAALITLFREDDGCKIEIPYKYLLRKSTDQHAHPHLHLHMDRLVEGEPLRDASQGKVYRLNAGFAASCRDSLAGLSEQPVPIGKLLDQTTFYFTKCLKNSSNHPDSLLESTVFDFMLDIVTSNYPHRRIADINTWRQFHRLAAYRTDSFDSGERSILVIAGLTVDHTIKRNTFIPQSGFWMQEGRAIQARYYNAPEIIDLLGKQKIFTPDKAFLQYAEIA